MRGEKRGKVASPGLWEPAWSHVPARVLGGRLLTVGIYLQEPISKNLYLRICLQLDVGTPPSRTATSRSGSRQHQTARRISELGCSRCQDANPEALDQVVVEVTLTKIRAGRARGGVSGRDAPSIATF